MTTNTRDTMPERVWGVLNPLLGRCWILANPKEMIEGGDEVHEYIRKDGDLVTRMRLGLSNLVAKLDECIPHIDNACAMSQIHGVPYNGPNFGQELEAARAILKELNAEGE